MDFLLTPLVVIASHESLGIELFSFCQPTHETTTTDDSRLLSLNLSKTWRAYDIHLLMDACAPEANLGSLKTEGSKRALRKSRLA